ncbi:MAG: FAD-binding domain-containing protein [Leptospiraceae bacterium]|nr:FAD-binding domain-containing protein [Leptospiraceae bacterium]
MIPKFETDYNSILKKLNKIDPIKYGSSRNYIDGSVTYLSPYISRGVISTRQVLKNVLSRGYTISKIESFVKELCWRDYFQRVAQVKNINEPIKQEQTPVFNYEISSKVIHANIGIDGLDNAIQQLFETGYMHNHCRMYIASLVCNIAKSHWFHASQWMYYHLLDGDFASNACSWQWVSGANSNKKYYASQENINKYTYTNQSNTFLDKSYEEIEVMQIPKELLETEKFIFTLDLPENKNIQLNPELPTFIYNYYNLDPHWHKEKESNRILLLEPEFFNKYPVNKKCIDFLLELSKNIDGIQIYTGSFSSLVQEYKLTNIYYKEHPLNTHYSGNKEERDWLVEEVKGYYPSFFSYWNKIEKNIKKLQYELV